MSNVRLEFDIDKAVARRIPLFAQAQAALDTQIVKDSNIYCPLSDGHTKGELRKSGRVDSPGMISWNTPYARYQYYLSDHVKGPINYTTDGTGAKWFEMAKAVHRDAWLDLVQKALK